MTQESILKWVNTKNPNYIETKKDPIFINKFFYLYWKNYNNYHISWTNIKPIKFNFEREVNLRIYGEKVTFIGNIEYNNETASLIKNKKNYWCNNNSFLKSHLQKCVRRRLEIKAINTAYLMMENNMSDFLRRLPIIILEDVHIIQEIDIIVWFMVMSNYITVPESFKKWLLYIVKFISKYPKKNYYDKSIEIPDLTNLNTITNRSTILSLLIRKAYGGMKGDMKMINYIIDDWIKKLSKNFTIPIIKAKEIIILKTIEPDLYELCGVDFHCYPDIISILKNIYNFNEDIIKKTIWFKSSSINFRESDKINNEEIEKCWKTIKHRLFIIQKKYILKNVRINLY